MQIAMLQLHLKHMCSTTKIVKRSKQFYKILDRVFNELTLLFEQQILVIYFIRLI